MKKLHLFRLLFCAMLVSTMVGFTGCEKDKPLDETPTLEVSPTSITFDENGGTKTFAITTSGKWTITGAENAGWIVITPGLSGTGSQTITVTAGELSTPNTVKIKVKVYMQILGIDKEVASKEVTISQTPGGEQPSDEAIYSNNFDKTDATKTYGSKGESWPFLDQFDGWQNQIGTGASTVTYAYKNMSVRQSGKLSGGYDGASAKNKIFFGTAPATFDIENITLPAGKTNFKLVFGGSYSVNNNNVYDNIFKPESFIVILGDGTKWSGTVTYEKIGGDDTKDPFWVYYAANFTLKAPLEKLAIQFKANLSSGFAIDDVILTEGVGGQEITFGGGTPGAGTKNVTIPELIEKMTDKAAVLDVANDCVFEAVIVTDKQGGNFNQNNLNVMTPGATTEKNGLVLYGSGKYTNPADPDYTFQIGDKVKVTLKAGQAQIVNFNGLYEATGAQGADWVLVEKIGTSAVNPITITSDKLAAFQGMRVTVANVSSPSVPVLWCAADKFGLHTFKSGDASMNIFVQANMPGLVGTQFKASATGSMTGYATVNKNNAQLCPQIPADVSAFVDGSPVISSVNPASLAFDYAGGSMTVTVTTANASGYILQLQNAESFTSTISGNEITVTAAENKSQFVIDEELTINLLKPDHSTVVDTKVVKIKQATEPSDEVTILVADFSSEANYPADFPTLSAEKLVEAKTFKFDGFDYTFAGTTGGGYYKNYEKYDAKENPYILIGKQGAYIELPAVDGKVLASVTLVTLPGASKKVTVGIYDSSNVAVSGGEAILLNQVDGKLAYTYNLVGTTAGTKYRIYVANANNTQFRQLMLNYTY